MNSPSDRFCGELRRRPADARRLAGEELLGLKPATFAEALAERSMRMGCACISPKLHRHRVQVPLHVLAIGFPSRLVRGATQPGHSAGRRSVRGVAQRDAMNSAASVALEDPAQGANEPRADEMRELTRMMFRLRHRFGRPETARRLPLPDPSSWDAQARYWTCADARGTPFLQPVPRGARLAGLSG